MKKLILVLPLVLMGCATPSSYKNGVDGNVALYEKYVSLQQKQLENISACYETSPNKSECSILAASLNTTQILAGRAEPIRVAKSPGEIFESLAKYGMDKTVEVFGQAAVARVVESGFNAASKDPVVVEKEPLVIRPETISVNPVTGGASVVNTETIGIGAAK